MKEEQITVDYQRKRRELEEDEEILKNTQRKGEQLIQDTLSDIYHRIVQQSAVDSEPFDRAKQAIMQVENDYHEELSKAKKHVYQQQEKIEQDYRNDLQKAKKK